MKYITTHLALNAFYSIIILAIAMPIFWLICIFIFKHPLKSELATVITAAIKIWKAKKKQ
jgi:hypothetical protein